METAFALVILAGFVFGARFGFLLGFVSILASSAVTGGIGPWLPFQLIGAALVGLGAGLLPKVKTWTTKLVTLSVYAVLSSYFYGIFITAWTWPIFTGPDTSLSFSADLSLGDNVGRFIQFEVISGGLIWDTGRAITTVALIAICGKALITTLNRAATRANFLKLS